MLSYEAIQSFIFQEARALDERRWNDWLDFYAEDVEFWMPAWDEDDTLTTNPQNEVSLIYYANRSGLEDRVFRLRTGRSAASTPMPRTMHQISNVRIREMEGSQLEVKANWVTHHYRFDVSDCFYGYATYHLRPDGDSWKITRKHVVLLNDRINAVLDFYHL